MAPETSVPVDVARHSGGDDYRGVRIVCLIAVVALSWTAYAWAAFSALILTAAFFGDIPSRDRYIEAGCGLLSTMPVATAAVVVLWLLRYRWNLLWVIVPALVLLVSAVDPLTRRGDTRDPDPGRAVMVGDLVGQGTLVNWALAAVFAAAAVALVLFARRGHSLVPTPHSRGRER